MLQARRLPPQNREMKVAAAQISCVLGGFGANLRKIRDFASLAKNSGAELIVFPEMVDTGYSMPVIQRHATSWNEGAVPALQNIAKTLSLSIICEFRSGMVHPFTILRFLSMQTARSSRNIERP